MKDLISYIARALVDFPDEVEVSAVEGKHTTVLELRVAKKDMGKIIGRQGRTAQAIRTILSAASGKSKKTTRPRDHRMMNAARAFNHRMPDCIRLPLRKSLRTPV
jgi:predicted RNA-binding protein YlqC (UPF0109 family)